MAMIIMATLDTVMLDTDAGMITLDTGTTDTGIISARFMSARTREKMTAELA